ncbi:MAG TPA: hypothetical protein VK501_09710 [Baekduia sp.]|uniref:hypothetical protein n=1 Tax=Baekduia sp. TaxID=2600305 RepID=UPI002CA37A80|nr:hypothetical protein [Baekduia sp.]HMJ34184.1 hypothetical protein [Baekduia sp.]
MRCRAALALGLALATGACTNDDPPMPTTCTTTDQAGYERALRAAPGDVRLPGGVPISDCLRRVRTDGQLQELGAVVHRTAETLAGRVRDGGDVAAARELGYLSAAVDAGAGRSNGISAELARRVSVTGTGLRDISPAVARALAAGQAAGADRG